MFKFLLLRALLTFQAWGALLNNIKSCGTQFLHQHVATETTAASQYVFREVSPEHSDKCVDRTAV